MKPVTRLLIRFAVTSFQRLRRAGWFFTRPVTHGVHAIPLTPEGWIVLVKLTYAPGWRLPGGGRRADEPPEDAVLRELREEIGLLEHGEVRHVSDFRHQPDFRRGFGKLFFVRDVRYRPRRWSLEIEDVRAFPPDLLPPDTAAISRRQLTEAERYLR